MKRYDFCTTIYLILLLSSPFHAMSQDEVPFVLTWKDKHEAPEKRSYNAEEFNGIIYSLVCDNPNVYMYTYDPVADKWSDRQLLKSRRYEVWSLKELDGMLYHFHGMEEGVKSPSV